MYQNEPDSDDDYECYFLKPVNEYNINDKIKEANEELFALPNPTSPSVVPRKVTFRKILEEYDDGGDNISIVSVDSGTTNANDISPKTKLNEIPEDKEEYLAESETEEICEEIVELNLDQIPSPEKLNETKLKSPSTPPRMRSPPPESSECFREFNLNSPQKSLEKSYSASSSDDDLSIIVATYIQDELQDVESKSSNTSSSSSSSKGDKKLKSPKSYPKRFSFRKKKKPSSPARQKSENEEIKFNYKVCCEYRNAVEANEKLPKYTGYLSEYGLTKQQWEKRENSLLKRKNFVLEKNLKATETEIQKMDDNERAFTRWLKNKMRFPLNKTKNMFDFQPVKKVKKVKS